jgi:monofunctional biosynthetic peptidoglycan transglycosylase
MSEDRGNRRRGRRRGRLVRRLLLAVVAIVLLPFVLVPVYAVVTPVSMPMVAGWLTGQKVTRDWRPLADISPNLQRAVITAEDARFCLHGGVDWAALQQVIEEAGVDGPERGASTIAMQTVKNLFLWQGAGYVRKPVEIVLALWADLVWSKQRELEIYLNIAQWGPGGVFGAEAGARRAFHKSAASLSPAQAARMAAALPNPTARDPRHPDAAGRHWAATVAARARRGGVDLDCLKVARSGG